MRHCVEPCDPSWAFTVLSLDELASPLDPESGFPTFDIPDTATPVDEQVSRAQARTVARAAVSGFIRSLAHRDQEIVRRMFWEDQTQTAVAQVLGVSKMAISKAVSRIAKRGRVVLAAYKHLSS